MAPVIDARAFGIPRAEASATAFLRAFLQARVDGEGAEFVRDPFDKWGRDLHPRSGCGRRTRRARSTALGRPTAANPRRRRGGAPRAMRTLVWRRPSSVEEERRYCSTASPPGPKRHPCGSRRSWSGRTSALRLGGGARFQNFVLRPEFPAIDGGIPSTPRRPPPLRAPGVRCEHRRRPHGRDGAIASPLVDATRSV